jgi:glycosyltransferase involved in cell wall biosynthesis
MKSESNATSRPLVLVLAAHHPKRDPRISWMCSSLDGFADPFVLGVYDVDTRGGSIPFPFQTYEGKSSGLHEASAFLSSLLSASDLSLARAFKVGACTAFLAPGIATLRMERLAYGALRRAMGVLPKDSESTSTATTFLADTRIQVFKRSVQASKRILATLSTCGIVAETCLAASMRGPRPAAVVCAEAETLPAGLALKELLGIPVIYDAHEFKAHELSLYEDWERDFWTHFERLLVAGVDIAITVSDPLAGAMTSALGTPFASVPNCEPSSSPIADPDSLAVTDGPVRYVFQGGLGRDRGLENVIRAFAALEPGDAVVDLRGQASPFGDALRRLARELGCLGRNVFFPPSVDEHELVPTLFNYDVGLIPYEPVTLNNAYCCPNKLSQYMRAGLSILGNRLPYVEAIIGKYDCGVIHDNSVPSIIDSIQHIGADRQRLLQRRRAALRAVRTEFFWEKMGAATFSAIRDIVLRSKDQDARRDD